MNGADADFMEAIAQEQRDREEAADAFAAAIQSGDIERFDVAVSRMSFVVDGWSLALRRAGRVIPGSDEVRCAFLNVWVEHKGLARAVADRGVVVQALRILLPPSGPHPSIELYRGTTIRERLLRRYSFSWTTDIDQARRFAGQFAGAAPAQEGIVLATLAPAEAILFVRERDGWFDEGEVILDPFKLNRVRLVERGISGPVP